MHLAPSLLLPLIPNSVRLAPPPVPSLPSLSLFLPVRPPISFTLARGDRSSILSLRERCTTPFFGDVDAPCRFREILPASHIIRVRLSMKLD
jgi:hypothetical protein